jgi:hypothetical protein
MNDILHRRKTASFFAVFNDHLTALRRWERAPFSTSQADIGLCKRKLSEIRANEAREKAAKAEKPSASAA